MDGISSPLMKSEINSWDSNIREFLGGIKRDVEQITAGQGMPHH